MKEITAYQCDHCPKYYKHKHNAKRHEKECFHNPETRSCASCEHFINWEDAFNDGLGNTVQDGGYYCDHFKKEFERQDNGKLDLKTNCDQWGRND